MYKNYFYERDTNSSVGRLLERMDCSLSFNLFCNFLLVGLVLLLEGVESLESKSFFQEKS